MVREPLSVTHPEIAAQADGWDPTVVTYGSNKTRNWICVSGHCWRTSPNSRTSKGSTGCPICSNKKLLVGFNDLQTCFPDIAAEANDWDPLQYLSGSSKRMTWQCQLGHCWSTTISSRTTTGSGCPYCSNVKVLTGFNDLASAFPEIAADADGWDPSKVSPGTKAKLQWRCKLNHTWVTSVNLRTVRGLGCPFCSGQKILLGFNDLLTVNPLIAQEAHGWNPATYFWASTSILEWRCTIGHTWTTSVKHRTKSLSGCPVCSGRIVETGFNDLATKLPSLAKEAHGWDPSLVSPGSQELKEWICDKQHIWSSRIANRAYLSRGCPTCAKTGFDPNKPAWLYLLHHEIWGLLQVGISNVIEARLATHKKNGWGLVDLRGPMDGHSTYQWEQDILTYLGLAGAEFIGEQVAGKFTGFTESWLEVTHPATSLRDLMDKVNAQDAHSI